MEKTNKRGNTQYDKEQVLEIIAEYFAKQMKENELTLPVQEVYEKILKYAKRKRIKMPVFLQARQYIIEELTVNGLYKKGERFNTQTAYKLRKVYYWEQGEIDFYLESMSPYLQVLSESFLICAIRLPDAELIAQIAKGFSNYRDKSLECGRINTTYRLCAKIKKKYPGLVYAVVPENNYMVYLNENGKISSKAKEIPPICNSLLMFVKNCPEGIDQIQKIKQDNQSNAT